MSEELLTETVGTDIDTSVSTTLQYNKTNLSAEASCILPEDMQLTVQAGSLIYSRPVMSTSVDTEITSPPEAEVTTSLPPLKSIATSNRFLVELTEGVMPIIIDMMQRLIVPATSSSASIELFTAEGSNFFYGANLESSVDINATVEYYSPIARFDYSINVDLPQLNIDTSLKVEHTKKYEYSIEAMLSPITITAELDEKIVQSYAYEFNVPVVANIQVPQPKLDTYRVIPVDITLAVDTKLDYKRGPEHYSYDINVHPNVEVNTSLDFTCFDDVYSVYTANPIIIEFEIYVDSIVIERRPY